MKSRVCRRHFGCWPCIACACPDWTASGILWKSLGPGPNRANHETGHRRRKSKRGSRQDDDRGQSGRLLDRHQAARAARRSGSAGQCNHGLRHRQALAVAHQLRCDARRLFRDGGARRGGVRRLHAAALEPGPDRGGSAFADDERRAGVQIAQRAQTDPRRFRRDIDRLSAVAQHADAQRARWRPIRSWCRCNASTTRSRA
jgi:hypothetical protein